MTSTLLSALSAACEANPADAASLAAMADALAEAPSGDRVALVARWAKAAADIAAVRADLEKGFRLGEGARRYAAERPVNRREERVAGFDVVPYAAEDTRRQLLGLLKGVEDGRWYAFRLGGAERLSEGHPHATHFRIGRELRLRPLDGGKLPEVP